MIPFKEIMIHKAELAENIMQKVIDMENLIILNEASEMILLTSTIADLLKSIPHSVDIDYIGKLVDSVNEIVVINKEFYFKYWICQSSLVENAKIKETLEEAYATGNTNVFKDDWESCLCTLITYNLNYSNTDMDNVIKYKNELKASIKDEAIEKPITIVKNSNMATLAIGLNVLEQQIKQSSN